MCVLNRTSQGWMTASGVPAKQIPARQTILSYPQPKSAVNPTYDPYAIFTNRLQMLNRSLHASRGFQEAAHNQAEERRSLQLPELSGINRFLMFRNSWKSSTGRLRQRTEAYQEVPLSIENKRNDIQNQEAEHVKHNSI